MLNTYTRKACSPITLKVERQPHRWRLLNFWIYFFMYTESVCTANISHRVYPHNSILECSDHVIYQYDRKTPCSYLVINYQQILSINIKLIVNFIDPLEPPSFINKYIPLVYSGGKYECTFSIPPLISK